MPVASCSQALLPHTNHDAPLELEKKSLQKAGLDPWSFSLLDFPDVQYQELPPDESLISPALGSGSPQAAYGAPGSWDSLPSPLYNGVTQDDLDPLDLCPTGSHDAVSNYASWDAADWAAVEPVPVRCRFTRNILPQATGGTAAATQEPTGGPPGTRGQLSPHQSPTKDSSAWLSSLHIAARNGNDRIARILLQHNADCNEKDSEGRTPIIHAVIGGHEDVVRSLLSHGARIGNLDGEFSTTALHLAVIHRRDDLLRLLLGQGSRGKVLLDCYDDSGRTPLHIAIDTGFEAGVVVLLQYGADPQCKVYRT